MGPLLKILLDRETQQLGGIHANTVVRNQFRLRSKCRQETDVQFMKHNLYLKRRYDQRVQGAQRGDNAPKANLSTWRKDRERKKMRLLHRKLIQNNWSQKR